MRLTPASLKRSSFARSMVSGLVSSVTSASAVTSNRSRQDWMMAPTSSGWSSDGVPPPKKIVSARAVSDRATSSRRAAT
jgi:hypothetical protein